MISDMGAISPFEFLREDPFEVEGTSGEADGSRSAAERSMLPSSSLSLAPSSYGLRRRPPFPLRLFDTV